MGKFTNINQIEVLSKLGIDPDTADCYYLFFERSREKGQINLIPENKVFRDIKDNYACSILPCWSKSALRELLPSIFTLPVGLGENTKTFELRMDNLSIKYVNLLDENDVLFSLEEDGTVEPIMVILVSILFKGIH